MSELNYALMKGMGIPQRQNGPVSPLRPSEEGPIGGEASMASSDQFAGMSDAQVDALAAGDARAQGLEGQRLDAIPSQADDINPMDAFLSRGRGAPQYRDAMSAQTKSKIKEQLLFQQAGVTRLEENIKDIKSMPTGMDFTPLAAWIDSIDPGVRSNLAGAASKVAGRQLNAVDKARMVSQLEGQLQNEKYKSAQNHINALQAMDKKVQLGGGDNKHMWESIKLKQKATQKVEKEIRGEVGKLYKSFQPVYTQTQAVENSLKSGNLFNIKQSLANFARVVASEKGVLTDKDIGRVLPANFHVYVRELKDFLSSSPNQKLPKAMVENLRSSINNSKRELMKIYRFRTKSQRSLFKGRAGAKYIEQAYGGFEKGLSTLHTPDVDRKKETKKETAPANIEDDISQAKF